MVLPTPPSSNPNLNLNPNLPNPITNATLRITFLFHLNFLTDIIKKLISNTIIDKEILLTIVKL